MKKSFEIACLFALIGCSSEMPPELPEENRDTDIIFTATENTSKKVTTSRASTVASRFMNRPVSKANCCNVETVLDDNGVPTMYIINFDEGGFVIVSASTDYYPILASSETGFFDLKQAKNTGAGLWLKSIGNIISNAEYLTDSIKIKSRQEWNNYDYNQEHYILQSQSRGETEVYDMIAAQVGKWQRDGYTVYNLGAFKETSDFRSMPSDVQQAFTDRLGGQANSNYGGYDKTCFVLKKRIVHANSVGPLLSTSWGQGYPFNSLVPNLYPRGCTTSAAGQSMYYHKYPASFNWSGMAINASGNTNAVNETSSFLYDLAKKIGVTFGLTGTSATISQVKTALINYGYRTVTQNEPHNAIAVQNSLKDNRPVYMRGYSNEAGAGHAWVCDGFTESNSVTKYELWVLEDCPETHDPERFLNLYNYSKDPSYSPPAYHYNWGYSGSGNGYYSDNNPTYTFPNTQTSYTFDIERKELLIKP